VKESFITRSPSNRTRRSKVVRSFGTHKRPEDFGLASISQVKHGSEKGKPETHNHAKSRGGAWGPRRESGGGREGNYVDTPGGKHKQKRGLRSENID